MLKLAIIGCGRIVEVGHAPALESLRDRVQVVALADPSAAQLQTIGDRLGVPEAARYADYHDLLTAHAGELDFVDLALPHFLHEEITIACADASLQIFTEKPLSTGVASARRILAAAERNGVRLFIAHNYMYQNHNRVMFDRIRSGVIGAPFLIRSEGLGGGHWPGAQGYDPDWRTKGPRAGGGALLDNGYHQVYTAEAFMGAPAVAVTGRVGTFVNDQDVDDTAVALLDHGDGRTTSLQVGWSVRGGGRHVFEIHGTAGSIRFGWDTGVEIYENAAGEWRPVEVPEARRDFTDLLADVCTVLAGDDTVAVPNERAALHNLSVIEAVYRASKEDRRVLVAELEA